MRWLVLAFLVSLVALLVAVVGMVRHVLLHHRRTRLERQEQAAQTTDPSLPGSKQAPATGHPGEEPELN